MMTKNSQTKLETLLGGRVVSSSPDEILLECPECNREKLYFNTEKLLGYCHKCSKVYRLFDLVKDLSLMPDVLESLNTENTPLSGVLTPELGVTELEPLVCHKKALKYVLIDREIKPSFIKKYKICWGVSGELVNRVIIPIVNGDNFHGLLGRSLDKNAERKYRFSRGFKISQCVFPEDNISETTLLVEGVIDALRTGGVSVFSSHVSDEHINILKSHGVKKLFIAFDPDTYPNYKIHKACKKLEEHFLVRPITLPEDKDPADLGNEIWTLAEEQDNFLNLRKLRRQYELFNKERKKNTKAST